VLFVLAAIIPLVFLSRLVISSTHDATTTFWHFQLVTHPIVQAFLGKGTYLNQQSLYGFYPEMMRPFWAVFGAPTPVVLTKVMAGLLLCANIGFVIFMFQFCRFKGLAVAFALLAITMSMLFYPFWPGDSYFQFFPLRVIFPSIALVLMCFRSSIPAFAPYIILAFGVFWNIESGLSAFASYGLFAILAEHEPNWRKMFRTALANAGLAIGGLAVAFIALSAHYALKFGAQPNWADLTKYVRMYGSVGMYTEPMSLWGAWIIPVLVYFTGIFVGVRSLFSLQIVEDKKRYAALIAIAAMGILFSKYYQNRSVPLQLLFSSFPMLMCLGILVDLGLARLKRSGAISARALGTIIIAPLASALVVFAVNDPVPNRRWSAIEGKDGASALDTAASIVVENFKRIRTSDTDELLVVAPYVDLVQMKLGKPNPLPSPFHCALEFRNEVDALVKEIKKPTTKMIVFDHNELCYDGVFKDEPVVKRAVYADFEPLPSSCSRLGSTYEAFIRSDMSPGQTNVTERGYNIAEGKSARQSSQFGVSTAAAAVDGITNGNYAKGSVTHTAQNKNPWWEVDLGSTQKVTSIVVWNRSEYTERLSNYWVFMSDVPFDATDTLETIKSKPNVWKSYQKTAPCPNFEIQTEGREGRYVRVQLASDGFLSLAELQAFSSAP
jgi:hypothetical protein